jgi:chorismate mutase/prephenate dehydratase
MSAVEDEANAAIAALRAEIDALDDRLVPLLEERARVALALGEVKRAAGRPLRDAPREAEILSRLAPRLEVLTPEDMAGVYRALMTMCLELQARRGPPPG